MTDNMIEVKKDSSRQCQDGITKIGFTFKHDEIPPFLTAAALGKRYYLVLVDADDYDESEGVVTKETLSNSTPLEKSEGDKLRVRAVMLCKTNPFWDYVSRVDSYDVVVGESAAIQYICRICNINSRSELTTNIEAQKLFRELDQKFKDWQYENSYQGNLNRKY